MSALFLYLIKANIALTLFYLAYRFGLRRLTFYTLNRYFLLFAIACSALFPVVDLRTVFRGDGQTPGGSIYYMPDWNSLRSYATAPEAVTIWDLLQSMFWLGVAVMAIRFIVQLISLLRVHLDSADGRINNEKVKLLSGRKNPFSFFNNVYINPELHSPEERYTILAHEKVHVRGWHTIDVLAGELNHIFYWFNPGAWLMKKAIRENLEFITDRKLLQSGINVKKYQYTLLHTMNGLCGTRLANNFNLSHLKKRIMMMNKASSSRYHLLKYLFLIPATAAIALIVSSSKGREALVQPDSAQQFETPRQLSDFVEPADPTSPQAENGSAAFAEENKPEQTELLRVSRRPNYKAFLRRNPSVKSIAWAKQEKAPTAIIRLKNGKLERYRLLDAMEMQAASAKYGRLPAPPPPVPVKPEVTYTPPRIEREKGTAVSVERAESSSDSLPEKVLYIIDGEKISKKNFKDLSPADIYSISVLKDKKATEKYGDKGKNGVIIIETKKFAESNNDSLPEQALYIIDGKKANKKEFKSLQPANISSISVLKDKKATRKYGDKGRNGVIIIRTKDKVNTPPATVPQRKGKGADSLHVIFVPGGPHANPAKAPLYIVNNQVKDPEFVLTDIPKSHLYSIDIIKGGKAAEKYGLHNKNGVVKVFTKDFIKEHPELKHAISPKNVIINN